MKSWVFFLVDMASRTGRNRFRSSPGVVLLADPPVCRRERRGEKTTINSRQPLITTAFEAVWNRLITMRWYITAAITSTKTIKILSNIHSIEAAQCFSLNLNLQAPSPPGCVETRGSGDPAPLFLWGSGEAGAKTRGANQIDTK